MTIKISEDILKISSIPNINLNIIKNNPGIDINRAINNPNLKVDFSSVFATPPPINPATKGLNGIAIKCTIGIGIEIKIIPNPINTPLINLSTSYKCS
tara:strand:- start:664 stop:957 length:294 start_codon:yes stop_codon:yes gene_type:complete